MNNNIKFRAYYKPDFETKDGPLRFSQKEINGELFFVMDRDEDFKYPFFVPFVDENWIVLRFTGILDINDNEIYEGDIIKEFDGEYLRVVFDCGEWTLINNGFFNSLYSRAKYVCVVGDIFKDVNLLK